MTMPLFCRISRYLVGLDRVLKGSAHVKQSAIFFGLVLYERLVPYEHILIDFIWDMVIYNGQTFYQVKVGEKI